MFHVQTLLETADHTVKPFYGKMFSKVNKEDPILFR